MTRPGYGPRGPMRRNRPKQSKVGEAIATIFIFGILLPLGVLLLALGVVSLSAWGIMLILGIVHAHILPAVLPAGFYEVWPLALVLFIFGIVIGAVSSVLPGKDK